MSLCLTTRVPVNCHLLQALCRAIVEDVRDSRPLTEEDEERKMEQLQLTGVSLISHSKEINTILRNYSGMCPTVECAVGSRG